jgi:hypothetical protein
VNQKNIIGCLGFAGVGKDTVANYICQVVPGGTTLSLARPLKEFAQDFFFFDHDTLYGPSEKRNVVHFSYTDPDVQREILRKINSRDGFLWLRDVLPHLGLEDINAAWGSLIDWAEATFKQAEVDGGLSARKMLQTLGTEWGRGIDENIWVDYTLRRAERILRRPEMNVVVITDCRFLNEARQVSTIGEVWRITRPGYDGAVASGIAGHASERDQASDAISRYVAVEINNNATLEDLRLKVLNLVEAKGLNEQNRAVVRTG